MRGRKNHVHLNLVHNNQLKRWNDKTKTPNSELREWKVTGFNIPIAAIRIIVIRLFSEIHTRAESFVKKAIGVAVNLTTKTHYPRQQNFVKVKKLCMHKPSIKLQDVILKKNSKQKFHSALLERKKENYSVKARMNNDNPP